MQAVVYEKYRPPEVLQLKEVEKSIIRNNYFTIKIAMETNHRR